QRLRSAGLGTGVAWDIAFARVATEGRYPSSPGWPPARAGPPDAPFRLRDRRGLAGRIEERQLHHRRRRPMALRLAPPLDPHPRSWCPLARSNRAQCDHALQDRAPRRAGGLADLPTTRVQRERLARRRRLQRRHQPLGTVEILEGLPIELQPNE